MKLSVKGEEIDHKSKVKQKNNPKINKENIKSSRTLIQIHASSITRALSERALALSKLEHKVTKGELREIFVSDILNSFLTNQFSIGSGIIINQNGDESDQTDIIIYDNRMIKPFIKEQNIGVYPVESVIATVEVKSSLAKRDLLKSEKSAAKLRERIFDPDKRIKKIFTQEGCGHLYGIAPLCTAFGFYGGGVRELFQESEVNGKNWLSKIKHLFAICLIGKYCWAKVGNKGWDREFNDEETNEETKRFIALLLDNIRTYAEINIRLMAKYHHDWLSSYIRK